MDPLNYGLGSPRMIGMLQPKREETFDQDPGVRSAGGALAQLQQTPKRGETVSAQRPGSAVKAPQLSYSAFTPTHENHGVTHLQAMTPVTPLFSDYSTPKSEHERTPGYWADVSLTPETPGRKVVAERTVLADRLPGSSPFCLTPERQPLDFMSPERGRGQDSGRRGRPRADMVNNLIISGAQSGNPIKCKICSRCVRGKYLNRTD